jgi:hypothetical protein
LARGGAARLIGRLQEAEDILGQLVGLRGQGHTRLPQYPLPQRFKDLPGFVLVLDFPSGVLHAGQALQGGIKLAGR